MKKGISIFLILIGIFSGMSQVKPVEKVKDTVIDTEVVEIVTAFNPKIADAKKISQNPIIKLLKAI